MLEHVENKDFLAIFRYTCSTPPVSSIIVAYNINNSKTEAKRVPNYTEPNGILQPNPKKCHFLGHQIYRD